MPQTVFISYSKHDKKWRERIQRFLKPLELWGDAEVWADDRIGTGDDWYPAIKEAIGRSAVAILLVTTDFLGTEFIAKEEIPDLLLRRQELGMRVFPILVHDCPWRSVRWLKQIKIIPEKATPLDRFTGKDQDTFLARLTEEIGEFLEDWNAGEPVEGFAGEVAEVAVPVEPVVAVTPTAPDLRVDISHLPETGTALFGRAPELDRLDRVWEGEEEARVLAFIAQGGVGKSTLVNRWLREMEADGWKGSTEVFGWSFYSQGVRDQVASAEIFIDQALRFFGDPEPESGSPWDKGERLARLVAERRSLLILDGMEPLQSSLDFERGRLQDPGLQSLLRGLARESKGLCVITTREPLPGLQDRPGFEAVSLEEITPEDGRALLRHLRVVGTDGELEALAAEFGPTALAVSLLGSWLYEQPEHQASAVSDLPVEGEPLTRILAGFERMLGEGPELELLRLQGLFDRPATAKLLAAVRGEDDIPHLVSALPGFSQDDAERVATEDGNWGPWQGAVQRLRVLGLLARHSRHAPAVLDSHPLIRERCADLIRETVPGAWKEAHKRLYDHLCETTEPQPDTLDGLQPLYQAVAHGCQAGLHQQACDEVYYDRILRGSGSDGFYSRRKLGAVGVDMGAVACFFDSPWSQVSPNLSVVDQSWLIAVAAHNLQILGRVTEAVEPMRVGLEMRIAQEAWSNAAISASTLSEVGLTLGEVSAAIADAERSVAFADRSGNKFHEISKRATLAHALHQSGHHDKARQLFAEAETMQAEYQPAVPRLYSLSGFELCDLLLSGAERAAWRLQLSFSLQAAPGELPTADSGSESGLQQDCDDVTERATEALQIAVRGNWLFGVAQDHLTLGRAALYRSLLESVASEAGRSAPIRPQSASDHLTAAVDGLRKAGTMDHLPRGLLTRAWQRQLTGDVPGAVSDLDEAWEIAERGPMPLYQADIHLHRARLFGGMTGDEYPWGSPHDDLTEARRLIEETGYHRRDEELQDAEEALSDE